MSQHGFRRWLSRYRYYGRSHEIRDPVRELFLFRKRLWLTGLAMLLMFGVLLGRSFYLQVVAHQQYQTQAENNRIAIVPVGPSRGTISDRNGVVLAQSFSAYTLELTPSRTGDLETTLAQLGELIEITPRDLRRFRRAMEESRNFNSLPLRTKLSDEEVAQFAAHKYRFPGVDIRARLYRQYPFGETVSHVLGYIGRINERDIEKLTKSGGLLNYKGTDHIGKTGIELSYEKNLHGIVGFEEVEVDALGRAVRSLTRVPPIPGDHLQLTIDLRLQNLAEQALGDSNGAVVAIDPNNGEVLAMASTPGYDPNLFVEGIDFANWERLNTSPDKPLLNRPLRGAYPPGSTIKPLLALGALISGKRTADYAFNDPGYFELPSGTGTLHRFRDDKVGGHGYVDMAKSIVQSCDTYYYILASETDIDDTARFMSQFGFGQKTGIDLEGEAIGVLASRAWKRERFSGPRYREEHRRWYLGDSISAGIGQGYNNFTPLQLAYATATLANDGVSYRPHLVKRIIDGSTGQTKDVLPEETRRLDLKPAHLAVIKKAMIDVNREGTASRIFKGAPYTSAGKTGTSQVFSLRGERYIESQVKRHLRDHAWFIAYAPAEKPIIAVAVLVENGGFGSRAAAPIARALFDYYLTGARPAVTPKPDENDVDWEE
ncbi:MAG: penicillin-binding protein 2 [Burkholderiales bacterium]|jgi:penicillin-binding protein 2|nr:penicillin-binding protein 2 [Burkholderiales bacterium]